MITKNQMMSMLLNACPSFRPTWRKFLNHWRDEADDLPFYLALADFARHLIGMLEHSETASFPIIFQVVEQLQIDGEPDVREAAVIGLLEDLQNRNLHTSTTPEQFRPFLGVEASQAWDALYEFWEDVGASKQSSLLEGSSSQSTTNPVDPDSIQDLELRHLIQQLYRKE
jgi:hypothetical protein